METATIAAVLKFAALRPDLIFIFGFIKLVTFLVEKGGFLGAVIVVILPIWLLRFIFKSIPKVFRFLNRSFQKRYGNYQEEVLEPIDEEPEQVTIYRGKDGEEPDEAIIMTKVKLKKKRY